MNTSAEEAKAKRTRLEELEREKEELLQKIARAQEQTARAKVAVATARGGEQQAADGGGSGGPGGSDGPDGPSTGEHDRRRSFGLVNASSSSAAAVVYQPAQPLPSSLEYPHLSLIHI